MATSKKPKYYDINKIIKDYPTAYYYIVFGERSNGKTYSALEYAIRRYYELGEQFAYVRRFGEDVRKKNIQTLLSSHVENGLIFKYSKGEHNAIDYATGTFIARRYNEEGIKENSDSIIGYVFDLNSTEHKKSTQYPKVTTIIFDEFLSRQGYLMNEFVLFMNTLSTIIRDRSDVKIFMLGNTVNKFCPYFQEMGLSHIKEQKPGSVDVYTYGESGLTVIVEYCDPMSKRGGKRSDVYFAFDNPQLKMITHGSWEIAIYPHLSDKYRPKDVVFIFFVQFDQQLLQGNIIVTETDKYLFMHPKTTPIKKEEDIVYTDVPDGKWYHRIGIMNNRDPLSQMIATLIGQNKVFYSDNETGEILRNYLIWAAHYSSARGGK